MAIVEDEVRNESGEENEIEVVVEEDDADEQESGDEDSDDDGLDDEEILESKVVVLEQRVTDNPYNYDDHIELIQALWGLSELERWRQAFTRLHRVSMIAAEHWLLRLQTECSLAHSQQDREKLSELFQQATLDCYSIPILTEWCTWALGSGDAAYARDQLDETLKRAGPDPLSGKIFWDAKKEFERTQLEAMSEDDPEYKEQEKRVLYCAEEVVSRPLLHNEEAWSDFEQLATKLKEKDYIDKVKQQHEASTEFLQKISLFEDKLLTLENPEGKHDTYKEYIETVKELAQDRDKYGECDIDGILKVLYDRASYECTSLSDQCEALCVAFARHARDRSSRATYSRVLEACARRRPHVHTFWTMRMRQCEKDGRGFDEIKSILETALERGMESYKHGEALWLAYLESARRHTDFEDSASVEKLRRTFRLAWDSLAEAWGTEANDCEVPLFWARVEYRRTGDHKQGKDIFEEIFKYGDNKTMSKYWEALIALESARQPPPQLGKLRELHSRAVRFVKDYPPTVCALWTALERESGSLDSLEDCCDSCEDRLKEWRETYETQKQKKFPNQKGKGKKSAPTKKPKLDKDKDKDKDKKKNKDDIRQQSKGKRRLADQEESGDVKRKKETEMEVVESGEDKKSHTAKRPHDADGKEEVSATDNKRPRTESSGSGSEVSVEREACTLFVSNLDFNVNEVRLREKLSEFGDIVSLRVRAGVKAFGGSICYCQYSTSECVDRALKNDRCPLDGRPMFLSRYSSKKTKPTFRYPTAGVEKNKLFVRNLPFGCCSRERLGQVFEPYGNLRDVRVVAYKDGKPKGLAYIEYEDEKSAADALEKTNGMMLEDRRLEVALSAPPPRADSAPAASLGQPKRETGGMRRTQISSFIPRVLQRASTSVPSADSSASSTPGVNGQKQMSNSDFRSMLLKK